MEDSVMVDICPYSKNGVCNACRVLTINCDGERFALCTQYQIVTGKITPEEVGKVNVQPKKVH